MIFKNLFKKKEKKVTLNLGPEPVISKDVLDKLAEKLPENVRPTIVQTEGEITYIGENGEVIKLTVPLLNIVPIPRIKIEDVDTNFYDSSDFSGWEGNQVVVDIPSINITPVPNFNIDDFEYDENGFLKKKVKK